MAPSRASRFAAALLIAAAGVAAQDRPPASCSLMAISTSLDAQASTVAFRGVHIACDDVTIEADEATASEVLPEAGEWLLSGNLRLGFRTATVEAATARLVFKERALVTGELAGDPVEFEDRPPPSGETIRVTAGRLYFDNVARTARLDQRAKLVYGTSEISGCGILYDLTSGSWESAADCGEPFTVIHVPPGAEPAPPASEDAEDE